MKRKKIIIAAMLVFAVFYLCLVYYMHTLNEQHALDTERLAAEDRALIVTNELKKEVDKSVQFTHFLAGLLLVNPDLAREEIDDYGAYFLPREAALSYIIFARDDEIYHVYPHDERMNDFLGVRLNEANRTNEAARRRLLSGHALNEGPYQLPSGHQMLFSRRAVVQNGQIWGYAIVGMDFDRLLRISGLRPEDDDYYYALRITDYARGNVFCWGKEALLRRDENGPLQLSQSLDFQNMNWKLVLARKETGQDRKMLLSNAFFALAIGLSLTLMFGLLLRNYFHMKEMAETDPLTGAMNRAAFGRAVEKSLGAGRESSALFQIDLNRFKQVNDVYGHPAGDALIIATAHRLQKLLGKGDYLARVGGDEYTIFLQRADAAAAENFILQVRQAMERPVQFAGTELHVSLSIGYALSPQEGITLGRLYKAADKRMYLDKERAHAADGLPER